MGQGLTASEAAARLGVRRATLYAYVSRGLIRRQVADDGRTSRFDAAEVDAMRASRRRRVTGELDAVIGTALTRVSDDGLHVRGLDLVAWVAGGAGFEEVAERLWGQEAGEWADDARLVRAVQRTARTLPEGAPPIERLRVAVAVVGASDPLRYDVRPEAVFESGRRLIGAMVAALPDLGAVPRRGSVAARLGPRLTERRPMAARRRCLDVALALLADHGLATSTFAARVAASVRADPYSIVQAGLGALGGPLHGLSSRSVHALLAEAARTGDIAAVVGEVLRRGGPPPGTGHTVYRRADPRFGCLWAELAAAWGGDPRWAFPEALHALTVGRTRGIANIDMALGSLTWLAGMRPEAGDAIFAIARTAGWLAHGVEEYAEVPLRFRPTARYVLDE